MLEPKKEFGGEHRDAFWIVELGVWPDRMSYLSAEARTYTEWSDVKAEALHMSEDTAKRLAAEYDARPVEVVPFHGLPHALDWTRGPAVPSSVFVRKTRRISS